MLNSEKFLLERVEFLPARARLETKSEEKTDIGKDLRTYAKYLLREGSLIEKRELLANLKSKLVIVEKRVMIDK